MAAHRNSSKIRAATPVTEKSFTSVNIISRTTPIKKDIKHQPAAAAKSSRGNAAAAEEKRVASESGTASAQATLFRRRNRR